jgi:hypothetical protein
MERSMQSSVSQAERSKTTMAYALFRDDAKLSRTFPTREEALKKADEAGLIDNTEGKPVLEDGLTIKPCAPDPKHGTDADLDWTPNKR